MTIGYINVCQKGNWQKPFDMIMSAVKSNGLYEETSEIRLVILNDNIMWEHDQRFEDPKVVIVSHQPTCAFERHALVHMANYSETDSPTAYWYAHTKGTSHFGGGNKEWEDCITEWIKYMCHHNFVNWRIASEKLQSHDTYGCEHHNVPKQHYSGNFWWANSHYIKTLPKEIGQGYCDPEFWLLNRRNVLGCNIYSSGYGPGGLYSYSGYDEISI